jgi:putative ABC transport system permease protein
MSLLLYRAFWRYYKRHPWQLALAALGVTLGVAVVVAVDVASGSARRAFLLSAEAVTGRATHVIEGGPAGMADSVYAALRVRHGIDSIAPVVDRYVRVTAAGDIGPHAAGEPSLRSRRIVRLLGIDPFAERPFRPYITPGEPGDFGTLLTQRSLIVGTATAAALGVRSGDTLHVQAGARVGRAVVGGILEPTDALSARALQELVLAEIATAQELKGRSGIDRIEVRVADDAQGAALLQRIEAALPEGARLLETEAVTGATVRLTAAFETNLTALALVALVFGMFLIYNSMTFAVVRRRPLIGLLRAQGVTSREVFRVIMAEAALIGAAATVLGILGGRALGARLVELVARTVNDLYFTVSVTSVDLTAGTVLRAIVLGIGATLVAAALPARDAAAAAPRSVLARSSIERAARRRTKSLAAAGVFAGAAAAALLAVPSRSIVLGFAALFVLILAAALLTPLATVLLTTLLRGPAAAFGPVGRLAARAIPASLSRTAPAIAALSVALAVGIAVTIMVGSFRSGVERWLEQSLQADIYISAPDFGADRTDATLDPGFLAAARSTAGVGGLTEYRHTNVLVDGDMVRVIAVNLAEGHRDAFEGLDGGDDIWPRFAAGAVLASESFAYRRDLAAGDTLTLPAGVGAVNVTVAAIFRDYAREHGVLFMDLAAYRRLWPGDDAITNAGIFVEPGANVDSIMATLLALPGGELLTARSNRALREATFEVFDRTFVITGVLRLLALIVAFVGVTGALMALQLERGREMAVLRVTGLTPGQVRALVNGQSGMLGVIATLLSVPLGIAMAWAMVHVINRRSFGWSFELVLEPSAFLQALLVGVGAALLAGLWPAWRMSTAHIASGLREE